MSSVASVCASVCLYAIALTFESLDIVSLYLVYRYNFRISKSRLYQGHQVKVKVTGAKSASVYLVYMNGCLRLDFFA